MSWLLFLEIDYDRSSKDISNSYMIVSDSINEDSRKNITCFMGSSIGSSLGLGISLKFLDLITDREFKLDSFDVRYNKVGLVNIVNAIEKLCLHIIDINTQKVYKYVDYFNDDNAVITITENFEIFDTNFIRVDTYGDIEIIYKENISKEKMSKLMVRANSIGVDQRDFEIVYKDKNDIAIKITSDQKITFVCTGHIKVISREEYYNNVR